MSDHRDGFGQDDDFTRLNEELDHAGEARDGQGPAGAGDTGDAVPDGQARPADGHGGEPAPGFDEVIDPEGHRPPPTVQELAVRKRRNRQFWATLVAMSVMLLIGVGLILYPTIADAWNRHVSSRAVASYVEQVADTSQEERDAQLAKARAYNEALIGQGTSRFMPTEEETKAYDDILDVSGTGIMGYVTIPKINARLPIYHGTDETVLQIASGHMEGSSFPIGGESTHAVLTGHTGLPSAMLFTGLDTLEEGDKFTVTVYDDVLTYEVDAIHVVEPTDPDQLAIQEGRDLVSLVTCTPYGVNSHRLIVTGHRIPTPEPSAAAQFTDEGLRQDILVTVAIIVVVAAAIATVFITQRRRRTSIRSQHAHRR